MSEEKRRSLGNYQEQRVSIATAMGSAQSINQAPTRTVRAKSGNFVVHIPVSRDILSQARYKDGDEFTHNTYTAVTKESQSDHNFHETETFSHRYQLRQRIFKRQIKIALVITMYNESEVHFVKSFRAVQKNIAYLCNTTWCPFTWGEDGWKNFVVVIVADGRQKVNPKVLNVMEVLGLYVDKIARTSVDGNAVVAHIYEFTTQVSINEDFELLHAPDNVKPTQVIFVLKEQNAKKINSHKWFFSAICETIEPEVTKINKVTMLLDVGTKPSKHSLMHLYRAFDRNPLIGGACGEIKAELGSCGVNLYNPLVASQNFEYKMSNILDKPLESTFGYISVLPGAFSAYRYSALKGRPLEQYFKGEDPGADIFTSNLYLAEDRILCFELVTKKKEPWLLKYVKSASAETDVPDTLDELTSQRRRWLNGSFFASVHALVNFSQFFSSPHSKTQKALFAVQFLFDIRKGPGKAPNSVKGIDPFYPAGDAVFQILRGSYLFALVCMLITALGNRPRGTRWLYLTLSIFFGCLMILMLFMVGWSIRLAVLKFFKGIPNSNGNLWAYLRVTPEFRDLVLAGATTYGFYILASVVHLDPWHMVTSVVQYLLLMPTYTNIFMVYAFCNLHDVTWGTKEGASGQKLDDKAAAAKTVNEKGDEVFQYVSTEIEDVTEIWRANFRKLGTFRENSRQPKMKRDIKTKKEDSTRIFRTKMVLFWIICNGLLIVLFTNDASLAAFFPKGSTVNPYLTFLFWAFAVLAMIRFFGSCIFMVEWWIEKVIDARLPHFGGSSSV